MNGQQSFADQHLQHQIIYAAFRHKNLLLMVPETQSASFIRQACATVGIAEEAFLSAIIACMNERGYTRYVLAAHVDMAKNIIGTLARHGKVCIDQLTTGKYDPRAREWVKRYRMLFRFRQWIKNIS